MNGKLYLDTLKMSDSHYNLFSMEIYFKEPKKSLVYYCGMEKNINKILYKAYQIGEIPFDLEVYLFASETKIILRYRKEKLT